MLKKGLAGVALLGLAAISPAFSMSAATGQTTAVVERFLSHPPMRPLPRATGRLLAGGVLRFVAPRGNDLAAGTEAEPWATVTHAVRRLEPGDTLVLRGGVYYEAVEVSRVGEPSRPITIRSHPDEVAILDGGFAEFFDQPGDAWEPVTDGAEGEFRSTREYPNLGKAQGHFGDSMVPLHSYTWRSDLRSNEAVWTGKAGPLYCGPGLWYDPRSRRIHARLAHDRAAYLPDEHRYRGVSDPRQVPLVVTGADSVPLRVRDSKHLVIQDLVLRGAGRSAIEISSSSHVLVEGVTAFSGFHALRLDNTTAVRVFDSRFRGPSAPWSSRMSLKYKGTAGVLLRTAGPLTKNRHLEIAWSDFTDGHDGVFLGETREARFHHNLVENFNDDGIFLTARLGPNGPTRIYRNRIARCLSSLAFGWGRGKLNRPGAGVSIYRNVIEHLAPVYYEVPHAGHEFQTHYGNPVRDHGSPIWEPMRIYQNTFVARRVKRSRYLLGLGTHLRETRRDVFNNIFAHVEDAPGLAVPTTPEVAFRSDGNLFWSRSLGAKASRAFFERYLVSAAFQRSRSSYAPGWESGSVYGDPAFLRFELDRTDNDYRLGAGSPAVGAGVELPRNWPDWSGSSGFGKPDIGAFPLGAEPFEVGPRPLKVSPESDPLRPAPEACRNRSGRTSGTGSEQSAGTRGPAAALG